MALIIEIQDAVIQVIEARGKREGRFHIDSHFSVPFRDEEGNDRPEFTKEFRDLLKSNKVRDKKAHVVFNNRLTLSKEFTLPRIERRKMSLIVQNEMQMALNLSNEYVYDYMTLSSETVDDRPHERVLAFAIKEQHIIETEKWLKKSGISIRSIQTSTSTLINLLDFTDIVQDNRPVIVTDMQKGYTRFYLYYKQEIFMIRTVHPDISEAEKSGDRFVNLTKLLVNSIYNENELVVDKVLLVGNVDMITDIRDNYTMKIDIPCELADLSLAFNNATDDAYNTFCAIGAVS